MLSATTSSGWNFDNSYTTLPEKLFSVTMPTPVSTPQLVALNQRLAKTLGLDFLQLPPGQIAALFGGNTLPPGAMPIAQAYAGHQFGYFNVLGDGRAILLGEQVAPDGQRFDVQLKGAGPSMYSRRGDGRATLSAMLREYLVSEAMYHLGIPTTGSLAVVTTGEKVYRESVHDGAVLTRVAASHIRVGTFEYTSRFHDKDVLQALTNYTIQRHYPYLEVAPNKALALLEAVQQRQVSLITDWMRVGFIHGVMNTDNMSIAGETLDYGPCAFMNRYHLQTTFSSIDEQGRYAYGNQPPIAQWNLVRLAGALLPLIDESSEKAIELAQEVINRFPAQYQTAWMNMMRQKLGWAGEMEEDLTQINTLLDWMQTQGADYTNTFLMLQAILADTKATTPIIQWMNTWAVMGAQLREQDYEEEGLKKWLIQWRQRTGNHEQTAAMALERMRAVNPVSIPRNHHVEAALAAAQQQDFSLFNTLLQVLSRPYEEQPDNKAYQLPPVEEDKEYKTFCNT
jgi:serine/tyrosine/threonine adenylyltransferase